MESLQEQLKIDYSTKGYEDVGAYRVKLLVFDGPIDLLLKLIKETKIDAKSVFISEITGQFLEHIKAMPAVDTDELSDFLIVACQLLKYKSRILLPCFDDEDGGSDGLDERERLLKMIMEEKEKEFSMIRDASLTLMKKQDVNKFFKEPDNSVGNVKVVLNSMNVESMLNAFVGMYAKLKQETYDKNVKKEIKKDKYTVADKISFIKIAVAENESLNIFELIEDLFNKSEIIVTFQAILELTKMQEIVVQQEKIYGDIIIRKNLVKFDLIDENI